MGTDFFHICFHSEQRVLQVKMALMSSRVTEKERERETGETKQIRQEQPEHSKKSRGTRKQRCEEWKLPTLSAFPTLQ